MNAKVLKRKVKLRVKRKLRIRGKIEGSATLPRVSVFRSNRFVSAQAIDDATGTTLASIHAKKEGLSSNKESAAKLGASFAATLKGKGINAIVFDRNGYQYHGVIAAFGDALRENEIKF